MNYGQTILLLAALIPPIFLLRKIYKLDTIEKEPGTFIVRLFVFGGFSIVPAALIESYIMNSMLHACFSDTTTLLYSIVNNFVCIALIEEGVKFIVLKSASWESPEFNFRFDAIVYAVAVSLGFAAAENIGYVAMYGMQTALVRAVTSIPGHCIFGIYMGYYFGMARYMANRGREGMKRFYLLLSIAVPMLLHGAYDLCASSGTANGMVPFLIYVVILDIIAFSSVRKFSREDDDI